MHQETSVLEKTYFDVEKIRGDFPILSQEINGKPLIYFDNAATTQKPHAVIKSISDYYRESNANVHRALHVLADRATSGYENARKKVAKFINAASSDEIVFTSGATASINLVAHSWARKFLNPGNQIILSEMEHHSNIVPWQLIADLTGIEIKYIPVRESGILDMDAFDNMLNKNVKLISITHMSNVLGTVNPVAEIIKKAHSFGIKVLIDAAQSVPGMSVDVTQMDCDFMAFSSHKMMGPTGIGVLYSKKDLLEKMDPFMGGGEMIETVSVEGSSWAEAPHKFEAGTPNIAGAFGLSAAIDYLENLNMQSITAYKDRLTHYALDGMSKIKSLQIIGEAPVRGSAISFRMDGVHPFDLAPFLDQHGIAIRAGHHCAQPLMKKLNLSATSRASLYFYNTFQEIDVFLEVLDRANHFFLK
ncbi:MAG: cysteine desulfurase [Calditrichae bacterium]|nr:cysteine desulfurase [Calditrichia bacterium]